MFRSYLELFITDITGIYVYIVIDIFVMVTCNLVILLEQEGISNHEKRQEKLPPHLQTLHI